MGAKSARPTAPAGRWWTDAEVAHVLSAELLVKCADSGVPGYESVCATARDYEQARISYITAVSERYPTVNRKRAALRGLASRIIAAPIDWKAAADRISSERQAAVQPDDVIDLMEALKRSLARHNGPSASPRRPKGA